MNQLLIGFCASGYAAEANSDAEWVDEVSIRRITIKTSSDEISNVIRDKYFIPSLLLSPQVNNGKTTDIPGLSEDIGA